MMDRPDNMPPIRSAEIISTGNELLEGRTVDTNASWIADRLSGLGIEVRRVTSVRDEAEALASAWQEALGRADLLVST